MSVATLTEAQRAYQPYGAARTLFENKDRIVVLDGPAGTGKTLAVLNKLYVLCEKYPGVRVLIVRQTRESLSQTVLELWENQVLPVGHAVIRNPVQRKNRQSYLFPNGSEVVVGGLDNPTKIMSGQYDFIYIAEATEVSQDAFDDMRSRNRRYHNQVFNQMILDCNPDAPNHWIKLGWEEGFAGEDGAIQFITRLQSRYEDNPKYWDRALSDWTREGREYVVGTLGSIAEPMKRQRLRFGIWAGAEGAVYDAFDTARDVVAPFPLPHAWPRVMGMDFGAVNTAAVMYAYDFETQTYYLYREYHAGGRTAGVHTRYLLLNDGPFEEVVGGARAEGQWRTEFLAAGLHIKQPLIKEVDVGISRVYGMHKASRIKVFDTCRGYLAQKADYRYEKGSVGAVPKIHDQHAYHYLDAERYIIGHRAPEPNVRKPVQSGRKHVARAMEA